MCLDIHGTLTQPLHGNFQNVESQKIIQLYGYTPHLPSQAGTVCFILCRDALLIRLLILWPLYYVQLGPPVS